MKSNIWIIIGSICVAIGAFAGLGIKPKSNLWTLVIVIFVVIGTLAIPYGFYLKSQEIFHGVLLPANEPTPTNPCNNYVPPGALILLFGNSASYSTSGFPHTVLRVAGKDLLTIDKTTKGISITADIFSADNRIVTELIKNEFHVNPNNYHRIERPDKYTLIVYDQQKNEILNVRYINPFVIKILGIFHYPGHTPIIIKEDSQKVGGITLSKSCFGNNKIDIYVE